MGVWLEAGEITVALASRLGTHVRSMRRLHGFDQRVVGLRVVGREDISKYGLDTYVVCGACEDPWARAEHPPG